MLVPQCLYIVTSHYIHVHVSELHLVHALHVQVASLASLAIATAGVALLAPLTSHCTTTQCLFITEVTKLSG